MQNLMRRNARSTMQWTPEEKRKYERQRISKDHLLNSWLAGNIAQAQYKGYKKQTEFVVIL